VTAGSRGSRAARFRWQLSAARRGRLDNIDTSSIFFHFIVFHLLINRGSLLTRVSWSASHAPGWLRCSPRLASIFSPSLRGQKGAGPGRAGPGKPDCGLRRAGWSIRNAALKPHPSSSRLAQVITPDSLVRLQVDLGFYSPGPLSLCLQKGGSGQTAAPCPAAGLALSSGGSQPSPRPSPRRGREPRWWASRAFVREEKRLRKTRPGNDPLFYHFKEAFVGFAESQKEGHQFNPITSFPLCCVAKIKIKPPLLSGQRAKPVMRHPGADNELAGARQPARSRTARRGQSCKSRGVAGEGKGTFTSEPVTECRGNGGFQASSFSSREKAPSSQTGTLASALCSALMTP